MYYIDEGMQPQCKAMEGEVPSVLSTDRIFGLPISGAAALHVLVTPPLA